MIALATPAVAGHIWSYTKCVLQKWQSACLLYNHYSSITTEWCKIKIIGQDDASFIRHYDWSHVPCLYAFKLVFSICLPRPYGVEPAWEAPLLEPIWSPITPFPVCSCSSVNSCLFLSASFGPNTGRSGLTFWHFLPRAWIVFTNCSARIWLNSCQEPTTIEHTLGMLSVLRTDAPLSGIGQSCPTPWWEPDIQPRNCQYFPSVHKNYQAKILRDKITMRLPTFSKAILLALIFLTEPGFITLISLHEQYNSY